MVGKTVYQTHRRLSKERLICRCHMHRARHRGTVSKAGQTGRSSQVTTLVLIRRSDSIARGMIGLGNGYVLCTVRSEEKKRIGINGCLGCNHSWDDSEFYLVANSQFGMCPVLKCALLRSIIFSLELTVK